MKAAQSESEDLPLIVILCLVVIALPLAFLTSAFDVFGTVKYAVLLLAAPAALGFWAWSAASGRTVRLPRGWTGLLLAAFVVWLALSTGFSPVKLVSLFGLRKRLLGFITYLAAAVLILAAAQVKWDKRGSRALFYSMTGAAAIAGLVGIAQFLGSTFPFDLQGQFPRAAYSTFGNPVYFGSFLALAVPAILCLAVSGRDPQDRLVGFVGLPIALAALAATFSSGAILGAIAGGGIFLTGRQIGRRPGRSPYIAVAAVLAAAVAVASIWAAQAEDVSLRRRFWIWSAAAGVTAEQPIFGTGLDNLQAGIGRLDIAPESQAVYSGTYQDAHNNWLNLASTAGLPAAGLWLAFLGVTLARAARGRRPDDYAALAAAAGIAGYLVAVQFNPEDIGSFPLVGVWLGLVISSTGQTGNVRLKPSPALTVAAGLTAAAMVGAAWLPVNSVPAETGLLRANNAPDLETAIAAFEDVQSRQPWQSEYYTLEIYRLLPSLTSWDSRLSTELLEAARRGVAINPADPEARLALGHVWRAGAILKNDRRLFSQALSAYEQALLVDRNNPGAFRSLALVYSDLGESRRSLAWIDRYNRFFAADPELEALEVRLRQ